MHFKTVISNQTIFPSDIFYNNVNSCNINARHVPDSVARIGTTGVAPVRKLVLNLRIVCVNLSWLRDISGQKFWNFQNFGHDKM